MDDFVKPRRAVCLSFLLLAAAINGQAQALPDPTRPPASLLAPRGAAGGADAVAGAGGPQLQSVLIARHPGGRHVAVIDGQTVQLGGKYKGAVLVRMTDNEVVLASGSTRQVLQLYPTAPKRR